MRKDLRRQLRAVLKPNYCHSVAAVPVSSNRADLMLFEFATAVSATSDHADVCAYLQSVRCLEHGAGEGLAPVPCPVMLVKDAVTARLRPYSTSFRVHCRCVPSVVSSATIAMSCICSKVLFKTR